MDEFTRECLAILVAKKLTSEDVLERLQRPVRLQGCAGPHPQRLSREFTAKSVREWLGRVGVKTLFIEPGSPWEKGTIESFNGKLRDELLEREAFDTLLEANGALRAVAAALQHDPTAQCLGLSPPGTGGVAAPCVRFGYAEQAHGAGLLE